jgi:hypothetical protein
MIKRILKIIAWLICYFLLIPAILSIPIITIYIILKYIFKAEDMDYDLVWIPWEWVEDLLEIISEY